MSGLAPPDFIRTAAAAGARSVGLWPSQPPDFNPYDLLDYSLVDDAALRHDTIACLDGEGVAVALIDALVVQPERPPDVWRPVVAACAEIGARRFNLVSYDTDRRRTVEQVGQFAEIAAEYGCTIVVESCPLLPIATLAEALAIVEAVAAPNLKLLVDTMHVVRSDEVPLLSTINPALIDYVQISDGALHATGLDAYSREATLERALPGEGEMPLVEILSLVPPHVVVSGEVPMHARRVTGRSHFERSRQVVTAIRHLLDRVEAQCAAADRSRLHRRDALPEGAHASSTTGGEVS